MVDYISTITTLNWRWEAWKLLNDLSFFEWMDWNEIISLFIKCGAWQDIEKNLNKFNGLNIETAKLLIQRWASATMIKNLGSFLDEDREKIKSMLAKYGYIVK